MGHQYKKGHIPWHKGKTGVYKKEALLKMAKAKIGTKNHWKTGKHLDKRGYVMVYSPNHPAKTEGKYVREHRLVMEKHIGRFLKRSEVVHHIDGNKQNNLLSNLMLFPTHSAHMKYEKTR